jgi:hypothetical protein
MLTSFLSVEATKQALAMGRSNSFLLALRKKYTSLQVAGRMSSVIKAFGSLAL